MGLQQLTAQLTTFAQNVNVLGHNTTQAVRDLAAQLHATNETTAAQIVAVTQVAMQMDNFLDASLKYPAKYQQNTRKI